MQVVGMRREEGGRDRFWRSECEQRRINRPRWEAGSGPGRTGGRGGGRLYFGAPTDDSESATGRETSEARRERIGFFRCVGLAK